VRYIYTIKKGGEFGREMVSPAVDIKYQVGDFVYWNGSIETVIETRIYACKMSNGEWIGSETFNNVFVGRIIKEDGSCSTEALDHIILEEILAECKSSDDESAKSCEIVLLLVKIYDKEEKNNG
jgi:hypothetical protein